MGYPLPGWVPGGVPPLPWVGYPPTRGTRVGYPGRVWGGGTPTLGVGVPYPGVPRGTQGGYTPLGTLGTQGTHPGVGGSRPLWGLDTNTIV